MARPTNKQLCADFCGLLTEGFYIHNDGDPDIRAQALIDTKPWRNDLWKAFRELEDRLLPLEALDRERQRDDRST